MPCKMVKSSNVKALTWRFFQCACAASLCSSHSSGEVLYTPGHANDHVCLFLKDPAAVTSEVLVAAV
eukprot:6475609-Amphidinium_carterae.1